MYYFLIVIAGFGGGAVRGLAGFLKHQLSYKKVEFDMLYFLGTSFLSGIIGLLAAVAAKEAGIDFMGSPFSPAIAFIVGYAGGDFLESAYKIFFKKS